MCHRVPARLEARVTHTGFTPDAAASQPYKSRRRRYYYYNPRFPASSLAWSPVFFPFIIALRHFCLLRNLPDASFFFLQMNKGRSSYPTGSFELVFFFFILPHLVSVFSSERLIA